MLHSATRSLSMPMLLLLVGSAASCAVAPGAGTDLVALENSRYRAMVRVDIDRLDTLLDDDLIFTHASGKIDSKRTFLESLRSGSLVYQSIELSDVESRLFGSCGVVTGKSLLTVSVRGEDRLLRLRFTTVWVRSDGNWHVVAYQSSSVP